MRRRSTWPLWLAVSLVLWLSGSPPASISRAAPVATETPAGLLFLPHLARAPEPPTA